MRVHHFYPKTRNVGDHFVQRGIERMIREIVPAATFDLFNVNSRGADETGYGLTRANVERANRDADLVVVGGSNLYEGSLRWPWGVHLEPGAVERLRVPLFLLGLGTGSDFLSRTHRPSRRAREEIRLLNARADFSGVRDTLTLEWLRGLGVSKAELTGDPATFIFNRPARGAGAGEHFLVVTPPLRFWSGDSRFWRVRPRGRELFRAQVSLANALDESGLKVVVACNDPADLSLTRGLFAARFGGRVQCPQSPEEYFRLLSDSRAVVTGRLHTAVAAFSLGVPFLLVDADQRSHGFVETYGLGEWALTPSRDFGARLSERAARLLGDDARAEWEPLVRKRDLMRERASGLLRAALARVV
ncbi:MAG TPA: polysaccharide pyruvyl transferase family protein [Pyrinomonadaceae bacterium]|jgi:polysaccharide pyruvyl transferase WcaK-like protein|nr:polysaccharide pyruvyl transferase family protein [Pyrinomonadaceae bacterium]